MTTVFFPVGVNNQTNFGILTALNDAVAITTDSLGTVGFNIAGTNAGGIVTFEGTINGTTWSAIIGYPALSSMGSGSTTVTTIGDYSVSCGSFESVRARLSTVGSGSYTITIIGTEAIKHIGAKNVNPADLNATTTPVRGNPTSRSGTVTAASVSQQLMAANPNRMGWSIQNIGMSDIWFNEFGGAASIAGTNCTQIVAGGYFSTQPGEQTITAITIFCVTASQPFTAKEW